MLYNYLLTIIKNITLKKLYKKKSLIIKLKY